MAPLLVDECLLNRTHSHCVLVGNALVSLDHRCCFNAGAEVAADVRVLASDRSHGQAVFVGDALV